MVVEKQGYVYHGMQGMQGMVGLQYLGQQGFYGLGNVHTPSVSLVNTTQGKDVTAGGSFHVGDSFRFTVSGLGANIDVSASATQNGVALGTTMMGNTGVSGTLVIDGVMTNDELGNWVETWMAPSGGGDYPSLNKTVSFSVVAPGGQGGQTQQNATQGGGGQTNTTNTTNTTSGNTGNGGAQLPPMTNVSAPTMLLLIGLGIVGLMFVAK